MKTAHIECPECGSSSIKKRAVVHKGGTSTIQGSSSSLGFSFNIGRKLRPRAWVGKGSHRGKRQSLLAEEAAPLDVAVPVIALPLIMIFGGNGGYGPWSWAGFIIFGIWMLASVADLFFLQKGVDLWEVRCSICS